jgi:hypothetical protein
MQNPNVRLFLSCVSGEFGAYRDALRRALTRPNVEVKIQEDFKAVGGDTLRMLAEYVEQCEAVVHFIGDMAGSTPAASSIDDLLGRFPELETRLAEKGLGRDVLRTLTYTQWEAWLAIGFDKNLLIVEPAEGIARGPTHAPTDASRVAQAQHLELLGAINRYPGPAFKNEDNFVAQIFSTAVIDALVKAAKMAPPRQPRNLPLASLGDLFKGRDKALEELRAALTGGKGATVAVRARWRRQDAARYRIRMGARGRLFGPPVCARRERGGPERQPRCARGCLRARPNGKGGARGPSEDRGSSAVARSKPDVAHDPRQRGRPRGRQGRYAAYASAQRRPCDRH